MLNIFSHFLVPVHHRLCHLPRLPAKTPPSLRSVQQQECLQDQQVVEGTRWTMVPQMAAVRCHPSWENSWHGGQTGTWQPQPFFKIGLRYSRMIFDIFPGWREFFRKFPARVELSRSSAAYKPGKGWDVSLLSGLLPWAGAFDPRQGSNISNWKTN